MPTYLSPGVYVEEVESGSRPIEGVGTAVAAFVGLAEHGPFNQPTLVSNWTQFITMFGDFVEGSYLAHSVYGYFHERRRQLLRRPHRRSASGTTATARAAAAPQGDRRPARRPCSAATGSSRSTPAAGRATITVEVADAGGDGATGGHVQAGRQAAAARCWRSSTGSPPGAARQNVATAVNAAVQADHASRRVDRRRPGAPGRRARVRADRAAARGRRAVAAVCAPTTTSATSPTAPASAAWRRSTRSPWSACPDLMSAYQQGAIDLETVKAVQLAMIAHCELMGDRIAILDPPPGLNAQQIKEWRVDKAGYDSKYAALYWPWVKVFDPATGHEHLHAAERAHGRHLGPQRRHPRRAQGTGQRGRPRRDLAARCRSPRTSTTCSTRSASTASARSPAAASGSGAPAPCPRDPAWRYLNVRRLFNYLEESILNGTQWVVFEPNDDALWAKIRRTITAFLVNEWRKGALFGLTPDEAFYVKCDRETNPAEGIDAGQVVCEIGVAPVKPAEFVIFRLSQFSGGTSLVTE